MATVQMWQPGPPAETRDNMESSDMDPDDARRFIIDLTHQMSVRVNRMGREEFDNSGRSSDWAKQHYGDETYQLLSGIAAAIQNWDPSGRDVQELKEKYSGRFVEGVEIGERLAVYQDSDFNFTSGEDSPEDNDSKFTFTQ